MAVTKMVDLDCDHCGASHDNPYGNVKMVRLIAKRGGWKYRDGQDICPTCADPEGEEAE